MASHTLHMNYLDIVATQGAYLVPRPRTPVFEKAYDETFVAALDRKFELLAMVVSLRRTMYHEAADEWPIGHTPPEVKERRQAELRALDEMEEDTSDEGGDATPNGGVYVYEVCCTRPQEAHGLPTPPLQSRKRRGGEEKEEQCLGKAQAISTARLHVPERKKSEAPQVNGRKRRRTDNVDDEGEETRERPVKARMTAALRRQKGRPPRRLEAG